MAVIARSGSSVQVNTGASRTLELRWAGKTRSRMWVAAGYLGMVLAVLMVGLPVYWMLVGSVKMSAEVYSVPPTWLPLQPTLENYVTAWNQAPFGRYFLNTLITTTLGSGSEIVFATTTAFAFAFLRFPKREWLFLVLLSALMIPSQVAILPNFLTISRLGWVNTYQGIVLPGAAVAYGSFLLRQYFLMLPGEIRDAARVDGAGHLRMLVSVMAPLAKPSIVTFGLLSIVAKWNDFLWPLLVTNTKEMRVLSTGIYFLVVEEGSIDWGVVMAGSVFVVMPVLAVYLYAQRFIVAGIAVGAVKG